MAKNSNLKVFGILALLGIGGIALFALLNEVLFIPGLFDKEAPIIDKMKFGGAEPLEILPTSIVITPSEIGEQRLAEIQNNCDIITDLVCSIANDLSSNKPQRVVCYCFQGV